MRTTTKLVLFAALALLGMAAPQLVKAENLPDLQVRDLSKFDYVVRVSSNQSKLMNLYYSGTSTEAVVTITSTRITFQAPANVPDTAIGGTSYSQTGGTFDFAASTTNTLGKLCDAVNRSTYYKCALLGGIRVDDPKYLRDQTGTSGTNDLRNAGGFDVMSDTGTAGATTTAYQLRIGVTPTVGRRVRLKQCKWLSPGTLNIYGRLRKYEGQAGIGVLTRTDSTLVYRDDRTGLATSTATFTAALSGVDGGMEFAQGGGTNSTGADGHMVVEAGDWSTAQTYEGWMECWFEER